MRMTTTPGRAETPRESPNGHGHILDFDAVRAAASGRWRDILGDEFGFEWHVANIGKHGPCVVCGGTDRFRTFDNFAETGGCVCNQCGSFADGFKAMGWIRNLRDPKEIFSVVAHKLSINPLKSNSKPHIQASPKPQEPPTSTAQPSIGKCAIEDGDESKSLADKRGDINFRWGKATTQKDRIAAYLRDRGITISVPDSIRFVLHQGYYRHENGKPIKVAEFPAMVARIQRLDDVAVGLHWTYLDKDGPGKAPIDPVRKINPTLHQGACSGAAIRLYPALQRDDTIKLTEGIETGLAVRQATKRGIVWSTISAGNLHIDMPPQIKHVEIFADNGKAGEEEAIKAAAEYQSEGRSVKIIVAPTEDGISDWNDVLVKRGEDAIREALAKAEVWKPTAAKLPPASSGGGIVIGGWVKALDRDNFGRVVDVNGSTATVHFQNDEGGSATVRLPIAKLVATGTTAPDTGDNGAYVREFKIITARQLAEMDLRPKWRIKELMVHGEPGMATGAPKSGKTMLILAAAVSLAEQARFFGYDVQEPVPTIVFTGESGYATVRRTLQSICISMGKTLSQIENLFLCDELPDISGPIDLPKIKNIIKDREAKVVFFDPAYMCLLESQSKIASNVFGMGPVLRKLTVLGKETDSTVFIAHHTAKPQAKKYAPLDLTDAAMAGFAEWSRQWWLVSRRAEYIDGSGKHELFNRYGGSAGHSGVLCMDIDEGQLDENFGGKKWIVSASKASDHIAEKKQEKKSKLASDAEQKALDVLKERPDGEVFSKIKEYSGLTSPDLWDAIHRLKDEGRIEKCDIQRSNRKKPYEGFRIIE